MDHDTLAAMGKRLAQIRRAHKVTQEALADMLGVSPKHISHSENATSCLSLKNLIQFCNIFHCSMDFIVFGHQNDETLSRLPDDILRILNSGNEQELDRLNRFLQIYIELTDNKN